MSKTMNKIEKILAEIEKLTKNVEFEHEAGYNDALCDVKVIINTLSEEPVSEDLDEAAEEYAYTNWEDEDYHEGAAEGLPFDAIGHTEKAFKAGWLAKEQQIMKKAVEWLYKQLNYGRMECGNIEEFINDFRKAMSNIKDE